MANQLESSLRLKPWSLPHAAFFTDEQSWSPNLTVHCIGANLDLVRAKRRIIFIAHPFPHINALLAIYSGHLNNYLFRFSDHR